MISEIKKVYLDLNYWIYSILSYAIIGLQLSTRINKFANITLEFITLENIL